MSFIIQPPGVLRAAFPRAEWRGGTEGAKRCYLTFDDGPIPEVTPWVLEVLDRYPVKATFFCVGDNVQKYPEVYAEIIDRGHQVGNHTYSHMKAWFNGRRNYFKDIARAQAVFATKLFRPPHGQLFPWYVPALKKQFEKIVMWDVLSRDFDRRLQGLDVVNNVKQTVRSGSIIVFHDSLKAEKNLKFALPATLDYLLNEGFQCAVL